MIESKKDTHITMTDKSDKEPAQPAATAAKRTLSLKSPLGAGPARQNVAMGRSAKPVAVEVKKKRGALAETAKTRIHEGDDNLSTAERESRQRALQHAQSNPKEVSTTQYQTKIVIKNQEIEEEKPAAAPAEARKPESDAPRGGHNKLSAAPPASAPTSFIAPPADKKPTGRKGDFYGRTFPETTEEPQNAFGKKRPGATRGNNQRRNSGKLTVHQVINETVGGDRDGRTPSMAAQRRARERMRKQAAGQQQQVKQFREVIIPEVITVQELANRMTERLGEVVKKLMTLGIMATGNQTIDADTAELVVHEFGHTFKRVLESDVELGTHSAEDKEEDLQARPPL